MSTAERREAEEALRALKDAERLVPATGRDLAEGLRRRASGHAFLGNADIVEGHGCICPDPWALALGGNVSANRSI